MIDIADKNTVLKILRAKNIKAKKSFSQNFLINRSVLDKIIHAAELENTDNVIEIGCGLGVLTRELAQYAKNVIVYEKDADMIQIAKENTREFKNIEFINADVLKIEPPNKKYKLNAIIPYSITSLILKHFLVAAAYRPLKIVFLIQKEVAEKICALPPKMNVLALMVQVFGKPQIIARVPAANFLPPPKVDSAILKIDMHSAPMIKNYKKFFEIVRSAFNQKRKLLSQTLAKLTKKQKSEIEKILIKSNINPLSRPENLSIKNWNIIINDF